MRSSQKSQNIPSLQDVLGRASIAAHAPLPAFTEEQTKDLIKRAKTIEKSGPANGSGAFVRYLHDLNLLPLLNSQEEYRYAKLAQAGNSWARDILVKRNLRFVITLAKKYAATNVPFEDLVQEGNMGLMKAVAKFDPDRGVKLVSYAAYWIEQALRAAVILQGRSVRLPANRTAELTKVNKATAELKNVLGRQPTTTEISKVTDIAVSTIDLLVGMGSDVQLDAPTREDAPGASWLDKLTTMEQADDAMEKKGQKDTLLRLLASLKPRDAEILSLCFGLNGTREHTLEEVGIRLGISRERARQIRDRAIRELQSSPQLTLLEDFWT